MPSRIWKSNRNLTIYIVCYSGRNTKEAMLVQAFGNIKTNKEAMTSGTCKETIDGISFKKIQDLTSDFKNHTFKFQPFRRKWIPKSNRQKKENQKKVSFRYARFSWQDYLWSYKDNPRIDLWAIFLKSNSTNGFRPGKGRHHKIVHIKLDYFISICKNLTNSLIKVCQNLSKDIMIRMIGYINHEIKQIICFNLD